MYIVLKAKNICSLVFFIYFFPEKFFYREGTLNMFSIKNARRIVKENTVELNIFVVKELQFYFVSKYFMLFVLSLLQYSLNFLGQLVKKKMDKKKEQTKNIRQLWL